MDYPVRGRYGNAALSPLEDDAMQWLDGFYQLEHLIATRDVGDQDLPRSLAGSTICSAGA